MVLTLVVSGYTLRDPPPSPPCSGKEAVTGQCAETVTEESPGAMIALGGKACKSGWRRAWGLGGFPAKVIADLNLEG